MRAVERKSRNTETDGGRDKDGCSSCYSELGSRLPGMQNGDTQFKLGAGHHVPCAKSEPVFDKIRCLKVTT